MKSCMGYILEVDLSNGEIVKTKVPEEVYYEVLSGKGLGAWYLLKNIPKDADPLGPDNILGIVSGALTGTGALFCGRWMAVAKSPLTGGWGDSNCGGIFSPAIKQCGVDAIFFRGISEKPVYLYMDDKTCELRDASKYWGLDATEAEEQLTQDNTIKKKPRVAVIGQAGENLSCISGICNEGGRIAARSGLGAVMGSKRLKAIVLAGNKQIGCADPETMKKLSKECGTKVKKADFPKLIKGGHLALGGKLLGKFAMTMPMDGASTMPLFKIWGTVANTGLAIESGDGPILNWGGGPKDIPGAVKEYNPEKVKKIETAKYHCYACPLGCGGMLNISDVNQGEFQHTHKPEYETIQAFGPLLGVNNFNSIYSINERLNRAGMDSISAGGTVAFAIECYENGILTKEDTNGLDLRWGNYEAVISLVNLMIERTGIGDVLADGVKKASEKIGKESEQYAMHVGGGEPGMHDTRCDIPLAVHYAAEPAPGKHTIGMGQMYGLMALWDICSWAPPLKMHKKKLDLAASEEIALSTMANACFTMLVDGAGSCYYAEMMGVHHWKLIEYLNASGGWNRSGDEYMEVGKRIQTMRQMFNIKHGIQPADVKLPNRMLGYPPINNGPLKGITLPESDEQIQIHWEKFGWDRNTGAPLAQSIESLGINRLLELEV